MPIVRDRDYTVRLQRRMEPTSQRYEVAFATANEAGPPPDKHHIRVPTIRGRWLIEPGPDGKGSRVRYEVFSDPGGVLPSWLLNRVQSECGGETRPRDAPAHPGEGQPEVARRRPDGRGGLIARRACQTWYKHRGAPGLACGVRVAPAGDHDHSIRGGANGPCVFSMSPCLGHSA